MENRRKTMEEDLEEEQMNSEAAQDKAEQSHLQWREKGHYPLQRPLQSTPLSTHLMISSPILQLLVWVHSYLLGL